jgi:hypothetical protein
MVVILLCEGVCWLAGELRALLARDGAGTRWELNSELKGG